MQLFTFLNIDENEFSFLSFIFENFNENVLNKFLFISKFFQSCSRSGRKIITHILIIWSRNSLIKNFIRTVFFFASVGYFRKICVLNNPMWLIELRYYWIFSQFFLTLRCLGSKSNYFLGMWRCDWAVKFQRAKIDGAANFTKNESRFEKANSEK